MFNSWYKKSMPKVKEIKNNLISLASDLYKINGINKIYVWGSYAENKDKPNCAIRDLDIIAQTDFEYEDLLSITDPSTLPFNLKQAQLEEEGFNPDAVQFTKDFIKISSYNIDHWASGKNGEIVHWGALLEDENEWKEIKEEAERYALQETGILRKKIAQVNEENKSRWCTAYDYYFNKILSNIPLGWYASTHNIKDIQKDIIEI